MLRHRGYLALVLALLWMPATLCCRLEAAGFEVFCSDCDHCRDVAAPTHGSCNLAEQGHYTSHVPAPNVAPAALATFVAIADVAVKPPLAVSERRPGLRTKRPRDWLPDWTFVRRAAAPAHAPDSVTS